MSHKNSKKGRGMSEVDGCRLKGGVVVATTKCGANMSLTAKRAIWPSSVGKGWYYWARDSKVTKVWVMSGNTESLAVTTKSRRKTKKGNLYVSTPPPYPLRNKMTNEVQSTKVQFRHESRADGKCNIKVWLMDQTIDVGFSVRPALVPKLYHCC